MLTILVSLVPGAPAHAAGGTLAGTLTGHDGSRFEHFQVDIYRATGPETWAHAIPPRTITSWETGLPVGDFAINLPAGTYRACFSSLSYEHDEVVGQGCWEGAHEVFDATDIVITDGATSTIAPSLPRESRLRGRIVAPDGAAVSAYVAPYRRMPNGTWEWQGGGEQSLADGTFVVPDLDPGVYRICLLDVPREFFAECWEDVATLGEAHDVVVPAGSTLSFAFRLARRANIAGTVTRPPASTQSLYVTAHTWDGHGWALAKAGVVADSDGTYRLTGLDAGTFRVCAAGYDVVRACWRQGSQPADATDIVLAEGQARARINVAPGPAGFVTGTLPEMYLGAQGYPSVTALRQVGNTWQAESTGEAWPTGHGADWAYELGSLPTGTYVACVEHMDPEFVPAFPRTCVGNSPTPQGGIPFQVKTGETTSGIDIVTGRSGEIRGRVINVTEPVRVDLFTAAGRLAVSRTTDSAGVYRMSELPSATYYVGFHREAASSSLSAEWWRNRTDGLGLAGATPIPVDGNIVPGISATLDAGGVITGQLVDDTGAGVAGCAVRANDPNGSLAIRRALTGASGEFAIGGLSTAPYRVVVARRCSGTPTAMFHDAGSPTQTSARAWEADPVAVTRGSTSSLPADLVTGVPAITSTSPPTITGTPRVGRTLTALPGTWLPTSGVALSYRWFADGRRLAAADGRRLAVTPDIGGARIRVAVIASARGWTSAVVRSGSVGPVAP